jgi:hypothetical protein
MAFHETFQHRQASSDAGTGNGAALRAIAFSDRILTEIAIEVKEMALKVPLKGHHYDIHLYPNPQSSI